MVEVEIMGSWTEKTFLQVTQKCGQDGEYQKILAECREQEQSYHAVLMQLTEQQRQTIDDYIAICEELEFQFARVAFECGLELYQSELPADDMG